MAAVVAGAIALFAPCCISVMLPAYFAGSFQNRRVLVAMTFVFAAGIATVIVPIALGAQALRSVFVREHTTIYLVMGAAMLLLGVYTLWGGQIHLPMPGRRSGKPTGVFGVYSLGLFSGIASSCCAPVLAGVIALSGVASSFAVALGLGVAYVFGMVAPLFVISLLWDRRDWRSSRLFRPRTFTWKVGPLRRAVTGTGLASGVLLLIIGIATTWVGLIGNAMPASSGWQARFSARLQHYGKVVTDTLDWVPPWAATTALVALFGWLLWRAARQLRAGPAPQPDDMETQETATAQIPNEKERNVEHQNV